MRVLLPLKQSGTRENNSSNTSLPELLQHHSETHEQQEEQLVVVEEAQAVEETERSTSPSRKRSAVETTEVATKKRPRGADSKPPAKPTNDSSMTGPRREYPITEQEEDSVLENEPPPAFINHNNNTVAVATPTDATPTADTDDDESFVQELKKRGLEIVEQEGDGNCLFRAVSLQVYGDANMHGEVRTRCMDFMARDPEHFGQFVTDEVYADYIQRKRQDGVHGNHAEIQAVSELFNRPVEVFTPTNGANPLNIFHAEYKTADAPIRLSYHDGNHYNAVIDPLVPTAGLGLGLPGLQPGLADKMQMAKAVAESDQMADDMELNRALKESQDDALQRAIKESTYSMDYMYKNKAMALSDVDATNYELEQAVLESSLQTFARQEQGRKQQASPKRRRGRNSPPVDTPALPAFGESTSNVAAIPPAAASVASAASAASSSSEAAAAPPPPPLGSADEYPQTVQELVMNGFDLRKVVHAYELIGDNFDDLLAFLVSTSTNSS